MARIASGALPAISSAHSRASDMSSSSGTTLFTSPMRSDSSASSSRPRYEISAALAQPSRRGRDQVPPDSGTTPRFAKHGSSFADDAINRISQPSSTSTPDPAPAPLSTENTYASIPWGMNELRCGDVLQTAGAAQPSRRGRYQVPPDSGTTPRFAKPGSSFADDAINRMSQPSARSRP